MSANTGEDEPLVPYADIRSAPPAIRQIVERFASQMGFVANSVKLYMHRPEIAAALLALNGAVMRAPSSALDITLKQKCRLLATKVNNCRYCTTHQYHFFKRRNVDQQELEALLELEPVAANAFEQVCFDFVIAASRDAANIPEEIYERMKMHLSAAQIVELASVVGFWKMFNTLHIALRVPIEEHLLSVSDEVGMP